MKKKRYTMSEKRIQRDLAIADWSKRLEVLILFNQGWTISQIAKKQGISRQAVHTKLQRIKNMTIEEAEALVYSLE